MMVLTYCSVLEEMRHENYLSGVVAFGVSFPRYLIQYDYALMNCYQLYRNPKVEVIKKAWNLP